MDELSQGQRVGGLTIWKLLDLIESSWKFPARTKDALTLPPLQRNAVWRPKAILDLWRSVLEGLPIGLFYYENGKAGRRVVAGYGRKERGTEEATEAGFDLVDGQQRIRALALGKGLDEDRRLWVRFKDDGYSLRLTSRAQPFGYDATGAKLSLHERRTARKDLEGGQNTLTFVSKKPGRRLQDKVFDIDLFDYRIKSGDKEIHFPPLPYGCKELDTRLFDELLRAYGHEKNRVALAECAGSGVRQAALDALARDFDNLGNVGAVFMALDRTAFTARGDNNTLSEFFNRVGSGGTALSEAEQIYSSFKASRPEIRDTVEGVQQDVSAVFTPAQIMTAVLRIANMDGGDGSGQNPGQRKALDAIRGVRAQTELWQSLETLLLAGTGNASICQAFKEAKGLLGDGSDHYDLSDIILSQLRPELWQVLVYWCTMHPGTVKENHKDAVRFAMWWHFGVELKFQESAVRHCFRHLAALPNETTAFPARDLYEMLVKNGTGVALIKPYRMRELLRDYDGPAYIWQNHGARFPEKIDGIRTVIQWWYAVHMLAWLQRSYLHKAFAGYMPLTDHEDDLPYDRDHICARAHWGPDGRAERLQVASSDAVRKAMDDARSHLGNALGNFRLLGSSENRSDGAAKIVVKMPAPIGHGENPELGTVADFCLDYEAAAENWRQADGERLVWSEDRLSGFQTAVVNRTIELYRRFFDELGYCVWLPKKTGTSNLP